uniref:C2H2-type domain-containing protein n=1 Tax=Wuchereria bancrofti TaxID=6293 RepID=A0A1I8EW94_WUCBA
MLRQYKLELIDITFNSRNQEDLYDDCTMAVNSYDCDYNKPYSPESSEHGDEMDTSTYTPSPVQHYSSVVATSSNAHGIQLDGKTESKLSSSSIIIDVDDGGDDISSRSDSPSFKASLQTTEIEGNERVMGEAIEMDDDGLEEIIANALIEQLTGREEGEVRRRPYNSTGPDCDELRNMLAVAVRQEKQARELKKKRSHMSGVGWLISKLFLVNTSAESGKKERVVLDRYGRKLDTSRKENQPRKWVYHPEIVRPNASSDATTFPIRLQDGVLLSELPPPPPHPTVPDEIRKAIRAKMVRCKICKNRFIEKNLYERHLRDRHYTEYLAYLIQQEEDIAEQRQAELEANRIEELATGGYIPPEREIDAESYEVEIDKIPLPGELSGGIPARFDRHGFLRQPKRSYKKKVSPQCPFCDKRFRNEVSLKKHFVKKHPETVDFVQCLRCFKAVKTKNELSAHECDLTFICFECTPLRNLCTQQRLLNHRAKFHRGANSGFKCNMCTLKFLTPRKLRKHKKMAHVFTKTFPCHFCDELFTSECSVTTHERIHTGIIKFECRICDFKCNRFVWMEEHQKEEHGYICSVCQHKCAEWGALKDHTLQEHGGYLTSESNAGLTFVFSSSDSSYAFLQFSSSDNIGGSLRKEKDFFTLINDVAVLTLKHVLRIWIGENGVLIVLEKFLTNGTQQNIWICVILVLQVFLG